MERNEPTKKNGFPAIISILLNEDQRSDGETPEARYLYKYGSLLQSHS